MALRLVPATYASPQAALAACASNDTIRITGGGPYAAQNLSGYVARTNILWDITENVSITLAAGGQMDVGNGWSVAVTAGKRLTLRCADGPAMYINGNGANRSMTITGAVDFIRNSGTGGLVQVLNAGGTTSTFTCPAGCTFTGIGSPAGANTHLGVQTSGSGARSTVTGCTFTNLYAGIKEASSAATSYNRTDRCTFVNARAFWAASTGGAETKSVLDVVYGSTYIGEYNCSSTSAIVNVYGATGDVSTSGFQRTTSHVNANVDVRCCWADTMNRFDGGGGTWNYNGYRVLSVGPAGAQDVVTLADPGFVNKAGNDYHLTAASTLRDAGDATLNLGATDHYGDTRPIGAAPDIGAAEFQAVDCGISTVVQGSPSVAAVTFVAAPAGPQIPLQASAETEANWLVSGDAGPLVLVSAVRSADLLYVLTFDRDIEPGETISVDSSAVTTDANGLCDTPGIGSFASVFGGLLSASLDDAETLRLTFKNGGAGTAPTEADVLDPANVGVSGALPGLSAVSIAKVSSFLYLASLARQTTVGEACAVDLTVGAPITTIGGGEVAVPAMLPFVGVQWPNGVATVAEAISPTEVRVTFDDEVWLSWPSLGSAGQAASWTVRLKGGSTSLVIASVRMESRYVYVLTLAVPMAVRPYEVVTDAVLTAHGGTCA